MKTLSSILTSPALMVLLAVGCTSSYKHVIIVHGILSGPNDLQTLSRFITEEHPSTKVTVIDLFNNMESIKPLWKQVHGVGKVIQRIMKKSPRGVHLLCFSQGGLICRGVLSVLPNHNVHAFIALASPLAGQYGDSVHFLCYNKFMQKRISLCNFWNDPHQQVKYLKHNNFLPLLNGRKPHSKMAGIGFSCLLLALKKFLRIKKLVLIGGPDDDVIIPWQSSHFGFYNSKEAVIEMRKQRVDTFGLRTLDARSDIIMCSCSGVKHSEWDSNQQVFKRCPHTNQLFDQEDADTQEQLL
uniref:palmitoyl-CoA hydrolase n=1 Tax=Oryzias latipes TaxID=8090 RepID=A0A3P9KIJ6_ORYLA